jgi:hypothetical protein
VHVQSPLTQARPVPQSEQAPPPVPHKSGALPFVQLPWESQHPAQFDGPQLFDWVSQIALTHACPIPQTKQFSPPCPHVVWLLPGWQFPLTSQHPEQVDVLQSTTTQVPSGHCSPFAHSVHSPPPVPHAPALFPSMQVPL